MVLRYYLVTGFPLQLVAVSGLLIHFEIFYLMMTGTLNPEVGNGWLVPKLKRAQDNLTLHLRYSGCL